RFLLFRGEVGLIRRLNAVSTLSPRLAASIKSINPAARVFLVPFALDLSLYKYGSEDGSAELTIGFVGSLNWLPTYLAARRLLTRIFPLVKRSVPKARLLIAGWRARKALAEFLECPDVSIVEDVPDSETYFKRLQVLTYPLRQGSGVKVKILEA